MGKALLKQHSEDYQLLSMCDLQKWFSLQANKSAYKRFAISTASFEDTRYYYILCPIIYSLSA